MKQNSYVSIFTTWLKHRLEQGIKTFTHRDILLVTGTNCSYTVLQGLRLKFDLLESKDKSQKTFLDDTGREITISKSFKVYEVIAEK